MVRSHPQQKWFSCILLRACRAARAMCSGEVAGDAGIAAAADDRSFSPELENGKRDEHDAGAATPEVPGGTAAALDVKAAQQVKGGGSNATEPTAGGRDAAEAVDVGKSMLYDILELKKKQKEAKDAKLAVQKELRNAERRRKRLKQRARQLSDSDLLAVMSLRNHEKALERDSRQGEEDQEDAEINPENSTASPSSASTHGASTKSRSQKKRRS